MSFAYLPLYTGDYLRDTRHLSPLRHGVYLLLLMHCWDQKGPLPLLRDECAGIANCRSQDEIEALEYVLRRFFTQMADGWYNKRMQTEVERSESISRARSSAGRKGYEAKAKQVPGKRRAKAKQVPLPPSPSPYHPHPHNTVPESAAPIGEQDKLPAGPKTWETYAAAYRKRYGTEPARNALTNALCNRLVKLLGKEEAPDVAGYYLTMEDPRYLACAHDLKALVHDAQKVRTGWKTGKLPEPAKKDAWWTSDEKIMAKAKELGVSTYGRSAFELKEKIREKLAEKA